MLAPLKLTDAWYPLRPHSTQVALWSCPKRFIQVPAGRGSGKTELAKRRLVRFLPVERGHSGVHRYAYLGPVRTQAKRIAWKHLKSLVPREWMAGDPSESDLVIRCKFGRHISEIHVVGMDRPERFEGDQWDGVVEDEASDQKGDIHLSVRPALAHYKGWWWKIGVPKRQGSGAPKYREACQTGLKMLDDPDSEYATYSWPSWDILPKSEIDQLAVDLAPKDFREQVGGEWQSAGGAAFYCYDESVHFGLPAHLEYDPSRPLIVCCDFNVNPMAWVLCQRDYNSGGAYAIDEVWMLDTNTAQTLDLLWDRYGSAQRGGWEFYGDAAGRAAHTSASYSDYAQICNDKRFKADVKFPFSNPGRKDRLASCNALLRNAAGDVRFWLSDKCQHLANDFKNRGTDEHGAPLEGKPGHDLGHISDALGYFVHYEWPSLKLDEDEEGAGTSIGVYNG